MAAFDVELMRCARNVTRLQARRRKLRKELKQIDSDMRLERKHLKAIAAQMHTHEPDVAPSKLFGDAVGYKLHDKKETRHG